MIRCLRLLALCLVLLQGATAPDDARAQAATPLPVEAFFQNPTFSGAALSPSGTLLAVRIGAKGSRDRLAVVDLASMKVQPVASFEDADVDQFRWVNERRLVFDLADRRLATADRAFARGLFAVNVDGSEFRQLVEREKVWVQNGLVTRQLPWKTFLLDQPGTQEGDEVMVVQPEVLTFKDVDYYQLLRLNTVTGLAQHVNTPARAFQWLLDERGEVRAVLTAKDDRAAIHWREPVSGQWRQLREFNRYGKGRDIELVAIAPDGKFYVNARNGGDMLALYLYDPATDTLAAKPLLATPQYDLQPKLISGAGRVLGARFTIDAEVTQWFDETMKAHQAEVDKLLPATANMLRPARRGNSPWLLVRAFSDVQPDQFLLYHTGTRKLTRLGSAQPGIQAAQMSTMDMVRYKARDGLEIPAYLTLPTSAATKKNLPLIVYVHGGPWVRGASWSWRSDVQFLASRGYAVLQPEFRGSTGFGLKHLTTSFKQWGLAMQDDLADGARWAIAQGIADPKRICIMGASYGGYATLMGLAKDGDLFRCGVQWVGVSDLQLLFDASWSDMSDNFKRYGMSRMIGDREKDAALLEVNSPLQQAARIKNPLLMGYGRVDRRVPIEHGRRMRDALKPHNPDVEYIEYEKDGHGWSLPETDVDWWTRVDKFLARHIGAAK